MLFQKDSYKQCNDLKWPCLQSLSREPVVRLDELQGRRAASTILWGIAVYFVTPRFLSFPAVKASRARQGKAKLRVASMGRSSTFSLVFYICAKQLLSNLAFYFFAFFFSFESTSDTNSLRHCNTLSSQPSATESLSGASLCLNDR